MLMATTLRGLGDACSDQCAEQYSLFDPQLQTCVAGCSAAPAPAAQVSDPQFVQCMNACDKLPGGPAWNTCTERCVQMAGSRYGSTLTVTAVPGGVVVNDSMAGNVPAAAALPLCTATAPGVACFQPSPATNWYKVGGLIAIGLASAIGAALFYKRAAHAS